MHPTPQIDGDWRYDMRRSCLVWSIELIDASNRTGSAEFVVPAAQPDTFFPIEVGAVCQGSVECKTWRSGGAVGWAAASTCS